MTGGAAKRRRKQKWRKVYANRIRDVFGGVCPNCKEPGAHFVPPSFGDPGFYICNKKEEK
jgi:hypothetical protein